MAGRPARAPVLPDVFDNKEPQILEILAEEDEDVAQGSRSDEEENSKAKESAKQARKRSV